MKSTSSHFPRKSARPMRAPDCSCSVTAGVCAGCCCTASRRAASVVNAWNRPVVALSVAPPASSTTRLASSVRRIAIAGRPQQADNDLHGKHQHRGDRQRGTDRTHPVVRQPFRQMHGETSRRAHVARREKREDEDQAAEDIERKGCLLYTSDAADDL